ncbi:hypothetical protein CSW64_12880 [Caulobacter mirabilis]|uniref:TonB C-terminal domain-containing protein n=2 Tax=Caulobacter mirabilis TaxID=69666 RepID=A0A2D2AYZ4_9CAUL|nr:hypothetical protein CSW64_12880 [Caulobacter mirabilis]
MLFQSAPATTDANPKWIQHADASGRTIFADFIGLPGQVTLLCELPVSGRLENCTVASATPEGVGHEAVALDAAKTARMSPKIVGGEATPTTVRFTMNFPEAAPFPPYKSPEPSDEALALARPIAARILAGQGSGRIVADVAADRQALVQSWIDELLPVDSEADLRRVSLQLARTMTTEQLTNIAAGKPPGGTVPDFVTLNAAQDPDPRRTAAADELRRRYCAQFDCRDPFEKKGP